ncbi:MAG: CrcB family protein [Elusimicrobiota bacterium]|jgi:CrcB protein|nr:CrcB family protein [Elusimicrobiota bacterium]
MDFLIVGIGGFLGTSIRFLIAKILTNYNMILPFSTLFCNVIASILAGIIFGFSNEISSKTYLFFVVGFAGGLSTFSTFNLETIKLIYDAKILFSILNIFFNILLSFVGFFVGLKLIKIF